MFHIFSSLAVVLATGIAAAERPNLVLVFADDQRFDAMSRAGHPFLKTPNMDRLAKEGAYCKNAFVTLSLCSPSRACLQTGQYAHTHGVMRNDGHGLPPDAITFPKLLREAGYQTAFIGKWHMDATDEKRPGFDYWVSYKGQGVYNDPPINVNGERLKATGYVDDLMTDYAIAWMNKGRDSSRPFCLILAFKSVHGPFTPPPRCKDLYSDVKITRPTTYEEPLENKPAFIRHWLESEMSRHVAKDYERFIRDYNRTVRGIDDNLGRLLGAMEQAGTLDRSLILYTSDNGYYQGEHGGLYDKRSAYEESLRVPMVARCPGLIKPGTVIERIALNIDVAPTFLDAAGVTLPGSMQGRSLLPLLAGRPSDWRTRFYLEYFREPGFPSTPTLQGVRTERYKYVRYLDPVDRPELYDLKSDPQETRNLHENAAEAATLAVLKKELDRLIAETGAR